jgi:hypothetical protein
MRARWIWICVAFGHLGVASAQTVHKPIRTFMARFNDDSLGPNPEEKILEVATRLPSVCCARIARDD